MQKSPPASAEAQNAGNILAMSREVDCSKYSAEIGRHKCDGVRNCAANPAKMTVNTADALPGSMEAAIGAAIAAEGRLDPVARLAVKAAAAADASG